MARKNVLKNWAMFGASGADLSTASTTSQNTSGLYMDNIGIVVTWTGSPVGTLVIQHSNDGSKWLDFDFGSTINIDGTTDNHYIYINQFPGDYIRAIYTKTSGTGNLKASLNMKQIGG